MESIKLLIKDESSAGKLLNEVEVSLPAQLTSVEAIITARVKAEVEAYNNGTSPFNGLIVPGEMERSLNIRPSRPRKTIDAEQQCTIALQAFSQNGYFILIDNIQATSLSQMVVITAATNITFVKLTRLVGG